MNLGPLRTGQRSTKRLLLDELPLAGGNISTRRLAQSPIKEKDALRIYPDSFAFTLLLGLMASLPTFGIDAPPPKPFGDGRRSRNDLGRTGFGDERLSHELGSAPSRLWDDIGSRRPHPIVLFGCALVGIASLGFMLSISLSREPVLPLLQLLPLQLSGTSSTVRPEAQRWPT